jgi:hypothetical protein
MRVFCHCSVFFLLLDVYLFSPLLYLGRFLPLFCASSKLVLSEKNCGQRVSPSSGVAKLFCPRRLFVLEKLKSFGRCLFSVQRGGSGQFPPEFSMGLLFTLTCKSTSIPSRVSWKMSSSASELSGRSNCVACAAASMCLALPPLAWSECVTRASSDSCGQSAPRCSSTTAFSTSERVETWLGDRNETMCCRSFGLLGSSACARRRALSACRGFPAKIVVSRFQFCRPSIGGRGRKTYGGEWRVGMTAARHRGPSWQTVPRYEEI